MKRTRHTTFSAAEQLEIVTLARQQGLVVHFERPGGPLCIHDGRGAILRRSPSMPSARAWLLSRTIPGQVKNA